MCAYWWCCQMSASVLCSSFMIDVSYTGSHAYCPCTRNTAGPFDLINLNSASCRSGVSTVQTKTDSTWQNNSPEKNNIPLHLRQDTDRTWSSQMTCKIYTYTQMNTGASRFIQQSIAMTRIYIVRIWSVWSRRQGAMCVADRLGLEHRIRSLFSCNNAITKPGAGDTGERRQQPRHAKY